jgi:hypothetical protein
VKDENGDLLADSQNILKRQLLGGYSSLADSGHRVEV